GSDRHSELRLPIELSGLPVFDRDRSFRGYRGFGVCRDLAQIGGLAQINGFGRPARGEAAPAAAAPLGPAPLDRPTAPPPDPPPAPPPPGRPTRRPTAAGPGEMWCHSAQPLRLARSKRPACPRSSGARFANWRKN